MPRFISMGCVVLVLLGAIAPSLAGQGLPPVKVRAEKAHLPPPSLAELGKLYQALELPLPPKEAFFAMYGCFDHPLVSSPSFSYQLRMATGDPKSGYRIWQGFKDAPTQSLEIAFSRPPRPETVLRYMKLGRLPVSSNMREADAYGELGFAIQCHLLEHFELAKFFYGRVQKDTDVPANQTLVMLAWNYWAEELANPQRDQAEVARNLHNLADKHRFFEILASWSGADDEGKRQKMKKHKELLDRLDLTVKRSTAEPGSMESIVDELTKDWQGHLNGKPVDDVDDDSFDDRLRHRNQLRIERRIHPDAETKLRNMGFVAIPLLIQHVDDQRLVLSETTEFRPFYGQGDVDRVETIGSATFRTVGSRVRSILSAFFDLDPAKATKAEYLNAWNKIRSMTEADFVSKHLNHIEALNREFTQFLSEKYEDQSQHVYKTILSKGVKFQHFDILLASIVGSDIPKSAKVELFTRGTRSIHVDQQRSCLEHLLNLDNQAFTHACMACLDKLTWKNDGKLSDWFGVRIAVQAFHTEDPKARGLAEKYVKNLPLNTRVTVLKELISEEVPRSIKPEIDSFLLSFLEDTTLYQDPKENTPGFKNLGYDLSEIELRNFVSIQILKSLGIEISITSERLEYPWEDIRKFAKDEVKRRLEKTIRK